MKKSLLSIASIILISISGCEKFVDPAFIQEKAAQGYKSSTDKLVSETAYFGINLAGGEFGKPPGIYGKDYTYPNAGELDYYSSKGLKLIRLPFKWERLQPVLNGELDSTEVARIKYVVNEADERDMVILLDCHNYGRRNINGTNYIIGSSMVPVQSFGDFWTRMAEVFKTKNAKKSSIWGYDIMNEPHDMLPSVKWFDIAQEAINGIRNTDLNTNIIVSGDGWSGAWVFGIPGSKSDILKNLADPSDKLIYQAHVYFDKDASGTYKKSYDGEAAYPNKGVDRVKVFVDWLKANNKKGFVGEYGVPSNDSRWLLVLDNFLKYLQENGVNGTYWAGGPWWGNYHLSIEPSNGADKPQMEIVERYLKVIDFTQVPELTTNPISAITLNSAMSGGTITSEGDSKVFARGVCWSLIQNPTVSDNKTTDDKHSDSFISSITGLMPSTTYYVRSYATNKAGTAYGNNLSFRTKSILPVVTTSSVSDITANTAKGGGTITEEGVAPVTERGICWSLTDAPTTSDNKMLNGTGLVTYTSIMDGLTASTTYYVRAFASNSSGTSYGNSVKFVTRGATVTDIDGNVYNTVTIGTQVWMVENLKVTRYRNGDPIANVTGSVSWKGLTTGAYCWYNNDAVNKDTYGALYNWHAVNDSRNIAPAGWHVATNAERATLDSYLGGSAAAGGKLKEEGIVHWTTPNTGATNASGFTGVPAGYRISGTGAFSSLGLQNYIWSSTQNDASTAFRRQLQYNSANTPTSISDKRSGFSVRLIKD